MATNNKLTLFLAITWLIMSMSNFILGYEAGVSGILLSKTSSSTNQVCQLLRVTTTMFMSSLYLAAFLGSLIANGVVLSVGNRVSVLIGGVLLCLAASVNAFAVNVTMLILARLLFGFSVGICNQAAPVYLAEMAPGKLKEGHKILSQVCIIAGRFLASLVNFFSANVGWGWRLSLGFVMIPSLVMTVGVLFIPDTPKSLIKHGKREDAAKVLRMTLGKDNVEQELNDLEASSNAPKPIEYPWSKDLWQSRYTPYIVIAVFVPVFQQLTGVSVIMFYTPVLFKSIGINGNATIVWPIVNFRFALGATVVCCCAAYHLGRRLLVVQGCIQIAVCMLVVGILTNLEKSTVNPPLGYAVVSFVLHTIYAAGFAMSWGPLGWLIPSEMYPVQIRPAALSMSISVNMLFNFIMTSLSPLMLCHFMPGLYALFAIFSFGMIPFAWFLLPDTKGVPLEEMSLAWKKHPIWGRFIPNDDVRSEPANVTGEVSGIGNSDIATASVSDAFDTCTDTDMSDTATDIEEGKLTLEDNIPPQPANVW